MNNCKYYCLRFSNPKAFILSISADVKNPLGMTDYTEGYYIYLYQYFQMFSRSMRITYNKIPTRIESVEI